jgi:hypothetical protein
MQIVQKPHLQANAHAHRRVPAVSWRPLCSPGLRTCRTGQRRVPGWLEIRRRSYVLFGRCASGRSGAPRLAPTQTRCSEQRSWIPDEPDPRPHLDRVAARRRAEEQRSTRVSAGQSWCGAPRRNRTGDPILTIDARAVDNAMQYHASPHNRAGQRRCGGGCVIGQSEVAHSAVSGKSLARAPGWPNMGTNADAIVPVALDRKRLAAPVHCCRSLCAPAEAIRRRRLRRPLPSGCRLRARTDPAGDLVLNRAISRCGCGWRAAWVQAERRTVAGCAVKRRR